MILERDAQLRLLDEATRLAVRGTGGLLVIDGPLGSGKSALLQAYRVRLPETVLVCSAAASPFDDYPFALARQLLDHVLPDPVPDLWDALDTVAPSTCAPSRCRLSDYRPEVREAVRQLVARVRTIAARTPLVLVIDDLQWVDHASLSLLNELAGDAGHHLLVVATVSEGEITADRHFVREFISRAVRRLHSRPLSAQAVRELLEQRLGAHCHPGFAKVCHEVTRGIPLLVTASALELSVQGVAPLARHAHLLRELGLSHARARFLDYLRVQPDSVLEYARALAVLGPGSAPEAVGELANLNEPQSAAARQALHLAGLLAPGLGQGFVHRSARDAVEASMTGRSHRALIERAAVSLYGNGGSCERVADLLLKVPTRQGEWARKALFLAAETTIERGERQAGARYLRRALLEVSDEGAARAHLLLDLAVTEQDGEPRAALNDLAHALSLFPSVQEKAEALVRALPVLSNGMPDPLCTEIRDVRTRLGEPERLSGTQRGLALRIEARVHFLDCADPARLAAVQERLDALTPGSRSPTSAERELLAVLLYSGMLTGGLPAAESVRLAEHILSCEPVGPGHARTAVPVLIMTLAAADATDAACSWLDAAYDHGDSTDRGLIRAEQALVFLRSGRLGDAKDAIDEALAAHAPEGAVAMSVTALITAAVAMELRDRALAERFLLDADKDPYANDVCLPAVRDLLRGAMAAADRNPRRALEFFLDCGARLERQGWTNPSLLPWRTSAAVMHHRLGATDRALQLAEEELARAEAWGAPVGIGRALRVLGLLTGGRQGIALTRQAVDALETTNHRLELIRSLLQLGTQEAAAGGEEARHHLRRCRRIALECGAPHLADRALSRTGERDEFDLAATRSVLTPGERRIAQLVATGLSNRDVAELCEISMRAVEKHLTHAYRKLGVRGRSELTRLLSEMTCAEPAVHPKGIYPGRMHGGTGPQC
ncbi:AAA family ATPase [Streptomyces cellulosae]|uniref:AAA family ATPase n=1 Tax=Streptomyces cellulosae TaxID=1968 RepID=UPI0004C59F8C|nr:AAA family ATPase [Streptomyces cellulosae]